MLLIEEPENGVHPLRLYEIVALLRSLTERGVQILTTTHSPDLLNACKQEEVLVFRRPNRDSGTEIYRLPADFERRAMREDDGRGLGVQRRGGAARHASRGSSRASGAEEWVRRRATSSCWARASATSGRKNPGVNARSAVRLEGDLPRLRAPALGVSVRALPFRVRRQDAAGDRSRTALQRGRPSASGASRRSSGSRARGATDARRRDALVDARLDELPRLQRDVQDILAQCRERSAEARVAIGLAMQEIEIGSWPIPRRARLRSATAVGEQPVPERSRGRGQPEGPVARMCWAGTAARGD